MKQYKLQSIVSFILALLLGACDPIIERDELANSFTPDDIKLEVIQATEGGNAITLKMNTPGVTGYWDYGIGVKYTDEVSFTYPIPGKSTFTYYSTTGYMPNNNPAEVEYVSKSIEVQIDVLDAKLHDYYYELCGEDLQGKTWTFAGSAGDNERWWYMSPPDNPEKWGEAWWNAGGECCPPVDADGKMTFDLAGAANYTYHNSADAAGAVGSFSLDPGNNKLTVTGDNGILGNEEPRGNPDLEYTIIELTSNQMILYVNNNSGGTGWTWIFKPE